jgi:hypothetical protein
MRGAIPLLPQYTFMTWCSVKAQGQLYLYCQAKYFTETCINKVLEASHTIPYAIQNAEDQDTQNNFIRCFVWV